MEMKHSHGRSDPDRQLHCLWQSANGASAQHVRTCERLLPIFLFLPQLVYGSLLDARVIIPSQLYATHML